MKRITLGTMFLITTVGVVAAQTPPTPPARPVPAERPATPAPAPRALPVPEPPYRVYRIDGEEIRRAVDMARMSREDIESLRERALDAARVAREIDVESIRANADAVREQSARIAEMAREQARASAEVTREQSRAAADMAREQARIGAEYAYAYAPLARLAPPTPMVHVAPMMIGHAMEDMHFPRPYFVQGEPADSLYRLAHDVLNRGDFGRAAQMFKDIGQRYPNSVYQKDLPYWEAVARYRIGTTAELETAAKLLEPRASKLVGVVQQGEGPTSINYTPRYNGGARGPAENEVAALYIRINSTLASRGNNNAAAIVAKVAQTGTNTCDREDQQVKVEAISALNRMDPTAALGAIRNVLGKKDECTVELRKRSVFMLGSRGDADAASLLATVAKSDPSTDVRVEAIAWLPKVQGDAGVNMLEEILRTEQDERIQRAAVRTLTSSDNNKARSSMRALIDRKDAPMSLRLEAINSFSSERATTDDAAYLRNLYSRADNDRMKEAIVNAVGRIGGPENDKWIFSLANNNSESSQLRGIAINRLMRSNISVAELSKLYDASDAYDIRRSIVSQLERRQESEASDKLYDIVKNSTVSNIRLQALQALGRRKDPRSLQLLNAIVDGRQP
jgi:TolA-binding protein